MAATIPSTASTRLRDQRRSLPDGPGVYLFHDKKGKVLYVGISDTPAWVVSQAVAMLDYAGVAVAIGGSFSSMPTNVSVCSAMPRIATTRCFRMR